MQHEECTVEVALNPGLMNVKRQLSRLTLRTPKGRVAQIGPFKPPSGLRYSATLAAEPWK